MSTKFEKNLRNFQTLKIIIKTGEKSTLFRARSPASGGTKTVVLREQWSAEFFCGDIAPKSTSCALHPDPPIPPYEAGAEIWAVGFLFCGKQPLNILGLSAYGLPRRLQSATGTLLRAAHPPPYGTGAEIWAVGIPFSAEATAVETYHWHVSKTAFRIPPSGK